MLSISGYVPSELIKLVRLKQAVKYLQEDEYTMAEIAYMAGFGSASYFSKWFSQQFNVTPKEYADQLKEHNTNMPDQIKFPFS